jgi:hemerythrin-like domain-containing protein
MLSLNADRRTALVSAGAAALLLAGCSGNEEDVGAVEDLMREHGVIRRAVLAFRFAATKLRAGTAVDAAALQKTAALMRTFAEDYHERKLEEAYIFPAVKKAGGPAAAYVDTLIAQHNRGREINDYITDLASKGTIDPGDYGALATALDGFELMYAHHAAREDTVVFPAWKASMSAHQRDEMGEKFEEIEKQQFGKDGFEDGVKQITEIEQTLGIADISQFTPQGTP